MGRTVLNENDSHLHVKARVLRFSFGWRKEHGRVANPTRVERTERLEGSRFSAWQLYGLLAGGSRERLEVWQFYGPLYLPHEIGAMGKTLRWVIPGSRLLLSDRAAIV